MSFVERFIIQCMVSEGPLSEVPLYLQTYGATHYGLRQTTVAQLSY